MALRQIGYSWFNNETQQQFINHPNMLGSEKKIKCLKAGDLILLYNKDIHSIFGIGILRNFPNSNEIFRSHHLIDQPLYHNNNYNNYEINIKSYLFDPVSFHIINEICGLCNGQKIGNGVGSNKRMKDQLAYSKWVDKKLLDEMIAEQMQ